MRLILLLITFCFVIRCFATSKIDSTRKKPLEMLADRMNLKTPALKEGEYEIRIWKRGELHYGDAQMLYVLKKTSAKLTAESYTITFNKHKFCRAVVNKPIIPVTVDLWERLMKQDILTLPDEAKIQSQLHPSQESTPNWTTVEQDGSVSVHAKKTERSIWVNDGDYYFEIFSHDNYRRYNYGNP